MSEAVAARRQELTEFHAALLAFEKEWWSLPGSKEAEIRQRFDISTTRYYQLLNALIDTEAALAHIQADFRRVLAEALPQAKLPF